MNRKQTEKLQLPTNYGWISAGMHNYAPWELSEETRAVLSETFLRGDKDFNHLLRSCRRKWIVSVLIARTTVTIHIHDPDEVAVARPYTRSTTATLATASMFLVDRFFTTVRIVDKETRQDALHTHPIFTATRCLKPSEVKMLEVLLQSIDKDAVIPTTPQQVDNTSVSEEILDMTALQESPIAHPDDIHDETVHTTEG